MSYFSNLKYYLISSEFVMYCWPTQTSSRKCKMINDMFNQISKFHLAQLLNWKIHFGALLTIVVKPSLATLSITGQQYFNGKNVDVTQTGASQQLA